MVYRDDELTKLQGKVTTLEERLSKLEDLFKRGTVKPPVPFLRRVYLGFCNVVDVFRDLFTDYVFTFPTLIISAVLAFGVFMYFIVTNGIADTQARETAAAEALTRQCQTFCETNGYVFHDDRRNNQCYCGTAESDTTVFIIDVETGEHWTVSAASE